MAAAWSNLKPMDCEARVRVVKHRATGTAMAFLLGLLLMSLSAGRVQAHDISRGWTLTGSADKTCIKSRGGYEDHRRAYFSVRFETTVNIGIDRVCTTSTVVKRYQLRGRAMTLNGFYCWSTRWHTGNERQASISVDPIRPVCGNGTYRFETHGQLTDGSDKHHGTPFEWGRHEVK